jgi:HAD superfamily hydrolase (TIGR01509 family)
MTQQLQTESKNQLLKGKKIFIFDLHGVLICLNKKEVIRQLWKAPDKTSIILSCCNPFFLKEAINLWFSTIVLEEFITKMMDDFPKINKNRQAALLTANAQKPIIPMIDLVKKLKQDGSQIYIFSNIGNESIAILQEKLPDIFKLFDGVYNATSKKKYLAKPNPQSFIDFLNAFNLVPTEQLVFVDDKQKNIDTAASLGMATVKVKKIAAAIATLENMRTSHPHSSPKS